MQPATLAAERQRIEATKDELLDDLAVTVRRIVELERERAARPESFSEGRAARAELERLNATEAAVRRKLTELGCKGVA